MRNNKKVAPTEKYPKILWYQVKNTPPSDEQRNVIYNRHYERLIDILTKKYPTATKEDIENASVEQAEVAAKDEINKPTLLKKVVVKTFREQQKMSQVIAGSEDFIQWYDK